MENAPPVFERVLGRRDSSDASDPSQDVFFRGVVSTLVTALKRQEHVLISFRPSLGQSSISAFLEHVFCSLFPATVSLLQANGNVQRVGRTASKRPQKPLIGPSLDVTASPFLSNICVVESLNEVADIEPILRVMKESAVTVDDHQELCPIPFIVFGLCPENLHLPRSVVTAFSFHINLPGLPPALSVIDNCLFEGYESLLESCTKKKQIYTHKEITFYIAQLILRADCRPLVTSYIDVKTKLLLMKSVEDCAFLSGRDFIIPDDVQMVFPFLVTHRLLLPGVTTFETCNQYIKSIIDEVEVPVKSTV
jgi:MoxR-like ATPase